MATRDYRSYFGYPKELLRKRLVELDHAEQNMDHEKSLAVYSMSAVTNMASLAFGAYGVPEATGYEETASDGTTVRYLDWEAANAQVDSVLKITLESASRGLTLRQWKRGIQFSVGWTTSTSTAIRYRWRYRGKQDHYVCIRGTSVMNEDLENLRIRMQNWDGSYDGENSVPNQANSGNSATAAISLEEIRIAGPEKKWDVVLNTSAGPVRLTFSATFVTFEEACAAQGREKDGQAWVNSSRIPLNFLSPDWNPLIEASYLGRVPFVPYAFLNQASTSTQCWIFIHKESKNICVSFRGTEADSISGIITDVGTDLNYRARSIQFDEAKDPCILDFSPEAEATRMHVHTGFMNAYESIRKAAFEIVYRLTEGWSEEYSLSVVGHSLGGSLATFCAFEFANRWTSEHKQPHTAAMTFGAVKVGLETFVSVYNKTVPDSYRIKALGDEVPDLSSTHQHVNMEIEVAAQGQIRIQEGLPENQAGVSPVVMDWIRQSQVGITPHILSPGLLEHLPHSYHGVIESVLQFLASNPLDNGLRLLREAAAPSSTA